MKTKLTAKNAFLVVLVYLALSIIFSLFAAIFFRGLTAEDRNTIIDGVVDSGMIANILVLIILLLICFFRYKDSIKDIFFEREPFTLSKWYILYPLVWCQPFRPVQCPI